MKGRHILCAALFVALAAGPVLAAYTSIQHNLVNGSPDTSYSVATHQLRWDATDSNLVTLNDPVNIGGTISGAAVHLVTYFDHYVAATKKATFVGGSLYLSFMRNGLGPYTIGGPIAGVVVTTNSATTLGGEGLFNAGSPVLPGSGVWPASGLSSFKSLTINFAGGLPGGVNYNWTSDIAGRVETQYTLFPNANAAPEPTAMILLAAGCLLLRRCRRGA